MRAVAVAVALAVVSSACGGTDGTSGTSGTPPGTTLLVSGNLPLDATDATAVFGGSTCQVGDASVGVAWAALVASNQLGLCGYLQRDQDKAGARSLELLVVRVDPTTATATLVAGTYPIFPSPTLTSSSATLVVSQNDAACLATQVTATSGFVIVTSTDGGTFQGSISAVLSDGGSVMGPFDAQTCAASLAGDICTGALGPSNPTCAP